MTAALLIAITLLLTTSGQLLQKISADRASRADNRHGRIANLLHQPQTWWAAGLLGLGMLSWLAVLSSMEVSQAYPYLGLGYVLVMLVSRYRLSEHISLQRWAGVALIVGGIVVLSA